jgi:peptide/nickel transport system substrate-binding protein
VKSALEKADYQGEKLILMGATEPTNHLRAEVAADMLKRVGMNVNHRATDWGTVVQRRAVSKPPAEGGWNLFCTDFSSLDLFTPVSELPLRGNGKDAWFGWPTSAKIEEMRGTWFKAPDMAAQKRIAEAIQRQAFEDVRCYPPGMARNSTAFQKDITGIPEGFVIFWNVRRA